MTTIHTLPDELVDKICLTAERRDLWALIRTCTRFRRIGLMPYLAHFDITHSTIESGTLALSDSFFLILVVGHLRPIHRLICFEHAARVGQTGMGYPRLAMVLNAAPPIPDVLIYNRHAMAQKTRREALQLLARMPAVTDNLLLVVPLSPQKWLLSRPRNTPPIQWKLLPPPFGESSRRTPTSLKFLILVFGIPLLFAYLVSAATNVVVLLMWLYQVLWGRPWSFEERIKHDVGTASFSHWMRIQTLPGKLTLVTFTNKHLPELSFRPTKGLKPEQFATVVRALDFGAHLRSMNVFPEVNFVYKDLQEFLLRHLALEGATFYHNSILSSSLPLAPPTTLHTTSKINHLRAPLSYIPHLLPMAPNVSGIWFTSTIIAGREHSSLRTPAFDMAAYRASLEGVVGLPGTHPIHFTFVLRPTSSSLPWTALMTTTDPEAAVGLPLFETRLTRVTELTFYTDGGSLFRAAHLLEGNNAFARWLGLFPGLRQLTFAWGVISAEWMSRSQKEELEAAILGVCRELRADAIKWNIRPEGR
ncbi:hypothetical protein C8F01DRAFT_1172733 [Mycena amicta]|nr:hypothetical protein C8F01DRAFT_1172733 [Mycena amicta]